MTKPEEMELGELLEDGTNDGWNEMARRLRLLGERHRRCRRRGWICGLLQHCECGSLWPCPDSLILNGGGK